MPAITDGGLNLFESHAILKHLKSSRNCPEHWYPEKDIVRRAKIDEYMDWHHAGLRGPAIKYLIARFRDLTTDKVEFSTVENEFKKSLKLIENYWLKDPSKKFLNPFIIS